MITIAQAVEDELMQDDIALAAAKKGILNLSSYARSIQSSICSTLIKDVQEASIVTALSRLVAKLEYTAVESKDVIQSLAVHSNLESLTYERNAEVSTMIREIYRQLTGNTTTFLTTTQGINEVTIIATADVAKSFREKLQDAPTIYDKTNLVGITAKLKVGNLEIPNLIFTLTRRLAYKNVNIVEIVSTATELTYIIARKDLSVALDQLQKDL